NSFNANSDLYNTNLMHFLQVFQDDAGKLLCEPCSLAQCVKCSRCNREITDSAVALSPTEKFHRDCFCCDECSCPLGEAFYEHQSKRYCREDYLKQTAPMCAKCSQPIRPPESDQKVGSVPQIVFRSK